MNADDEREALASRLISHADGIDRIAHGPTAEGADMRIASALIRGRGPITDEMVKAALDAWQWHSVAPAGMRAALEAARDAEAGHA